MTSGSLQDPVLYFINFSELLSCWKILFVCVLYYIVTVLLFESVKIILRCIVYAKLAVCVNVLNNLEN